MNRVVAVDFISSTLFKCTFCNTRLQYPVMKVEDVGNFCGSCIEKTEHKEAVTNDDMHTMLLTVQLFCKYRQRGCPAQKYFKDISEHEKICDYRDRKCPFIMVNKCEEVACENLVDHVREKHSRSIKTDDNNSFEFDFDLTTDLETVQILTFGSEYFILHAYENDNEFVFFVYYMGAIRHTNNFTFAVQHRGESLLTKTKLFPSLHDSQLSKDHSSFTTAASFDLSTLKSCLGTSITTILTVNIVGFEMDPHSILECLECPVCNDFMSPEIVLCRNGHSICGRCRKNLKRCPMCLGPFSMSRNYALESVGTLLKGPYECRSLCPRKASNEHDCAACCHSCPFTDNQKCDWHGLYKDIIEHLREEHLNNTFFNHQISRAVYLREEICDVVCLVTQGYTFMITTRKPRDDDRMSIQFRVVGQKKADKYNYRLTTNSRMYRRMINYNIPIHSMNATQDCVTYNVSCRTLARIVHNNRVVITYSIAQR